MKKFNCPYCNERYYKQDLPGHIDKKHDDMIPENYTAYRLTYDIVNNKQGHGNCTECGKPTKWNEKRQKYERLCGNPKCYARVKETYQKRMLKIYNKVHLLDDPEHQEKMLAHRKISGTYKWSDGKEFTYTGQYEKKLMEFLDKTMEFKSNEILAPGPILEYEFEGQKKHWITDFLIIPHNLIIEVKDGGDNPNKRNMPITRNKTLAKERMITNMGKYNYLRLTNNDFLQLFQMMVELKEKSLEEDDSPLYRIHESVLNEGLLNLLNLTFYHASTQVYKDTIPAQAPQLGTKIYDPHWSVYMWSNRENAMIYLIWVGLFQLCKDEEIDFKSISQDLLISPMDKCIYMVHNDKIENLMTRIKGYIYTIKPSILDIPNMRLGHTIYQNEYTINHDAKIKSREFVEIDDHIIKQFIVFVSKETLEKNRDGIRNKTRSSSVIFYPGQERSVLNYKYDSLNARGDIDHNKPLAPQLNKDVIAKTDFKRVKEVFDQLPKSEQRLLLSPGRTDYIDSPKSIIRYVYIKDREFVGFAELFDFQNNGNAQLSIAVIPKYRGKDYNIATRLLRTAEEHVLQSDKYNKIVYMVYKDNQRSINFAKKNGYTLEDENNTDYFYTKNIDQDTLTESSGIILNEGIDKKYTIHKIFGEAQSTFENGYIKKIGFMDAKYTYDSLSKKEKILMNSYGNDTTFHDDDKVIARFGYFDSRSMIGMLKKEELAGFLELTDYKDGYIYISIVVLPKFRGQGISHKLIDYAEDYARRKGYKNIRYVSNKKNKASQHLVQKREDYKLSDTTRDCYVYDKPLKEEYTNIDQQSLTEASFIPMEVPDINKEEISMSESKMPLLFSEDDIYCNFKNLEKYHIIFVTGITGSGKSTLAEKIANYYGYAYMSIDTIHWLAWKEINNNSSDIDSVLKVISNNPQTSNEMRLFLQSKEIKILIESYRNLSIEDIMSENLVTSVVQVLIDFCETNNIPAVIEGVQVSIINRLDQKYNKYPFVFKGTSLTKALIRKIDRDGFELKKIGSSHKIPGWYSELNNIREYIMSSTDDIEYKNENFYNEEALFRETEEYYIQESVEWDSCVNMAKNELDKSNDFIEKFFLCTPTETLEIHPKSHKEFFSLLQFNPKRKFINQPKEEKKFKRDINGFWIECIMYPGSTKKRKNWNFSSYWVDPDKPSEGWVIGIVKE